jgi:hypothetical protein
VHITNLRNAPQRVLLYWLPQGSDGSAIAPKAIQINALAGISSEDFVTNVMQHEGVGAIEIVGVTDANQPDPNALLHVASRIWTPRPDGASGTMSQTFPTIVLPGSSARVKTVFGVRRSDNYRLNVGVANPSDSARNFRVQVILATVFGLETVELELTVPARSMLQRLVSELTGSGSAQVLIQDITPGASVAWEGWASSVDNDSGDAWSEMAFPASQ